MFVTLLTRVRKEYVDLMRSTQKMTEEELKCVSERYDSIYLHPVRPSTYTSHVLSMRMGCVGQSGFILGCVVFVCMVCVCVCV